MTGKIKALLLVAVATALVLLPQAVAYADPIPWPGG
jgi:hypothetical protein